jgi:dTDP-L-rhamnose 4-epimerase
MIQRILVTGGAGFIGSRLVDALHKSDPACRVWVFDNMHSQIHGSDAQLPRLPEVMTFCLGDMRDKDAVFQVVADAKPDLIYHLAAETGTGQSFDEVSRYCEVNISGTAYLIEALRSVNYPTQRIVVAASRAIYGEGGYKDLDGREYVGLPRLSSTMQNGDFSVPIPAFARLPVHPIPSYPGLPPAPASIYASTKLMQEYLLRQACEGAPWKATLLRLQNVYGPGQSQRNPYTGVLSIFAQQLLSGQSLSIYEDGEIARDFVYVDDVVSALLAAGQANLPHGTTIDIGLGQPTTILRTAKLLMQFLGCSERGLKVTGQFRVGDIRYAAADISAARELLSWSPAVAIEDGLSRLAQWAIGEHAAIQHR